MIFDQLLAVFKSIVYSTQEILFFCLVFQKNLSSFLLSLDLPHKENFHLFVDVFGWMTLHTLEGIKEVDKTQTQTLHSIAIQKQCRSNWIQLSQLFFLAEASLLQVILPKPKFLFQPICCLVKTQFLLKAVTN